MAGCDPQRDALALRRRLGYLSTTTGLWQRLSGREQLQFVGQSYGLAPVALEAAIARVAEAV